jgi:hypothetical protein
MPHPTYIKNISFFWVVWDVKKKKKAVYRMGALMVEL